MENCLGNKHNPKGQQWPSCPERQLNMAHLEARCGAACSSTCLAGIVPVLCAQEHLLLCLTQGRGGKHMPEVPEAAKSPLELFGKRNADHQLGEDSLLFSSCGFWVGFQAEPASVLRPELSLRGALGRECERVCTAAAGPVKAWPRSQKTGQLEACHWLQWAANELQSE